MNLRSIALSIFIAASASAQTAPAPSVATQVAEASGLKANLEAAFVSSMDAGLDQLRKNGGEKIAAEASKVMRKFFAENFKWEELLPIYAQAYADEYSEAELKELLAFYQTPLGMKVALKTSALSQKASKVMSDKMKDKMPQLQEEMMRVVREELEKQRSAGK